MKSKPRSIRFTLRTLLLATGLMALAFSVVLYPLERNRRAMNVVVFRHGGAFIHSKFNGPKWSHRFLPQRCYINIAYLSYDDPNFGNEDLREVVPERSTSTCFRSLSLRGTAVTDEGIELLAALKPIEELDLANTKISDESLRHLSSLSHLREMTVTETGITMAGVDSLRKSLPNCVIHSDVAWEKQLTTSALRNRETILVPTDDLSLDEDLDPANDDPFR